MVSTNSDDQNQSDKPVRGRTPRWALLAFVPWAFGIFMGLRHWHDDLELAKRAKATTGTITTVEIQNHYQYDYDYIVGAATYTGGEVIPGNTSLATGDHVRVSYDPDNPQTSTLTDFGETDGRPIPLLLCALGGVVCYVSLRRYLRQL